MTVAKKAQEEMEEREVTVYKCDFCGNYIGEEKPDYTVAKNPRLLASSSYSIINEGEIEVRELEKWESMAGMKNAKLRIDDDLELCKECLEDIFDLSITDRSVSENASGLLSRIKSFLF